MLPILYWTNMSGVYDIATTGDRYYMATIGGILITDRNLFPVKKLDFSSSLPSNIVVSVDTLAGVVWFTTTGGTGYISGEDVVLYPSPSLPVSDMERVRGAITYGSHLLIYSDEWIMDIDTRGTPQFNDDRIRLVEMARIEPTGRRPINHIAVHRDTLYVADSLGVIATHLDFMDIPASYIRIKESGNTLFIRFLNDTMYLGTADGLMMEDSTLMSGYAVIYFLRQSDTFFLSLRVGSSDIYAPGFLGKFIDGNLTIEYMYPSPYIILPYGNGLLVSLFYWLGDAVGENSKGIGLVTYPDWIPHFYGDIPFNYTTGIYADGDWLYIFTGRIYNTPHDTLGFMGVDMLNRKLFNPDDSEDYSVRGIAKIDDSTFALATFFSIFTFHKDGTVQKCYDGTNSDGDAFTSITATGDTLLATAHSGQVFRFYNDCTVRQLTPYGVVGIPRAISYNPTSHLIAVGGDGGIAIYQENSQVLFDPGYQVKALEPHGTGFLIGTGQGLYRYDGFAISPIQSVPQEGISDIIVDKWGRPWILSQSGLYQLDRQLNLFQFYRIAGTTYDFATNWPLKHNLAIYMDTLLLAGSSQGIAVINLNTTITFPDSIIVYPNPAYEMAFIRGVACADIQDIRVMTMTGIPQNVPYSCDNGIVQMDTSRLKKGLYIVDMMLKWGRKTLKLIRN